MKEELYDQIYAIEQRHWWYVARRKIIFDWVFQILREYNSPRILDIGCGTGSNIEHLHLRDYRQVTGLDISTRALRYCQSKQLTDLVCGDSIRPPFRPQTFDVIMALDLIEHLEDDVTALQRLADLLRPGGQMVVFTPAFNFLWGRQDDISHHFRRYTSGELKQKLEMAGFSIEKMSYANTFLFPVIWAGRVIVRLFDSQIHSVSENDLHPSWSNGLLQTIFAAERPLLRLVAFPFGVSLLCIAKKRAE